MNNFQDREQRQKIHYLIHFPVKSYINYILDKSGHDLQCQTLEIIKVGY